MKQKIFAALLPVFLLVGCTTVQQDPSPFFYKDKFYSSQAKNIKKDIAKVCVVTHNYPLFRYGHGVNKKAVDLNNWEYGLKDALSSYFSDVKSLIPGYSCRECDLVVDTDLNLTFSDDKNKMAVYALVNLKNYHGESIKSFVIKSDYVQILNDYTEKIPLLNKNSKEENSKLFEILLTQVIDELLQKINSDEFRETIDKSIKLAKSDFGQQDRSTDKIIENKNIGIPLVTDLNFTRVGVHYFLTNLDKNQLKDGRAMRLLWDTNEFKKNADSGKEFFLIYNPIIIENDKYKENTAKIAYHLIANEETNNFIPGWVWVDATSEYSKNRLTKFKPGDSLILYTVAGSDNPALLLPDWARKETNFLRTYAINYLSGKPAPVSKKELANWNLAREILATALLLQEKEGTSQCYVTVSPERLLECISLVPDRAPRFKFKKAQIQRKLRDLDARLKKEKSKL